MFVVRLYVCLCMYSNVAWSNLWYITQRDTNNHLFFAKYTGPHWVCTRRTNPTVFMSQANCFIRSLLIYAKVYKKTRVRMLCRTSLCTIWQRMYLPGSFFPQNHSFSLWSVFSRRKSFTLVAMQLRQTQADRHTHTHTHTRHIVLKSLC